VHGWRVRYLGASGQPDFDTANEIRIPTGRPVELSLASADVIHSFWVPNLAGKIDMIPGRTNRVRLFADRAGVFRGQCAEYCGGPHAQMALYVIADSPERFEAWRDDQRKPATRSDALFAARCGTCHTIRGTAAAGTRGPDLTHVASRGSLGAGVLPMSAAALADWTTSSQHLKPGNLMPEFRELPEEELRALATYLASLE
jgi:cytochrome c oxidase subunit 2